MKTDKHFHRSETYFLINFKGRPKHKAPSVGTGPETQAWDGVALAPVSRGDSANSALTGQGSGAWPNGWEIPATFLSLGPMPVPTRTGREAGLPKALRPPSRAWSESQETLRLSGREEQEKLCSWAPRPAVWGPCCLGSPCLHYTPETVIFRGLCVPQPERQSLPGTSGPCGRPRGAGRTGCPAS